MSSGCPSRNSMGMNDRKDDEVIFDFTCTYYLLLAIWMDSPVMFIQLYLKFCTYNTR
jgi:hypothetical protein